mgnify:CR=1 FL=1
MRISDFPAGIPTVDESELVLVVQGGLTQKLTLAQANALRQPFSTTLVAIAGLTGSGYLYRDGAGTWSFDPGTGGSYDPAGTAAAAVASHDADSAAHGGIVLAFLAHRGVGGLAEHPVADSTDPGFMPALPTDPAAGLLYLDGLGNFSTPNLRLPVARIDDTDSPYAAGAGSQIVIVDASANPVTVDLPEITAAMDGCQVVVKARDATNTITINCDAADDIDGGSSVQLLVTNQSYTLVASYDAGGSFWSVV